MQKRFVSLWFPRLSADWVMRRRPDLREKPFVLAAPERGRIVIKATNAPAETGGAAVGMLVADCRAVLPDLQVLDVIPGLTNRVLDGLAEWCLRFTPVVATDPPDGLLLDTSGCTHLWGGEEKYLGDILSRLQDIGYTVRAGMADTAAVAWAVARFGTTGRIVRPGAQREALLPLPPAALRLPPDLLEKLDKLGFYRLDSFIGMPRTALRRRFGTELLLQLDKALGNGIEMLEGIRPVPPYAERLPAFEPVRTAKGIEIALEKLLRTLCERLAKEEKGLRNATFKGYRIDGNVQQISIGTNRPARDPEHLLGLFALKINTIEPALGFELFVLEASRVEYAPAALEQLWQMGNADARKDIAGLLDRIGGKIGLNTIHRYLPKAQYWPENSFRAAVSLEEQPETIWRSDRPRPVHLLPQPQPVEVMVQLPDYPPVHFLYKGTVHRVTKADGPERIEQEWWLQDGDYRDYYCIEDEEGLRYWLFRSGTYANNNPQWFLHGFFA